MKRFKLTFVLLLGLFSTLFFNCSSSRTLGTVEILAYTPQLEESFNIHNSNVESSIKIGLFISNLTDYNNGEFHGKWVELPVDSISLEGHIREISLDPEDVFISSYKSFFDISKFENIRDLNKLAVKIRNEKDLIKVRSLKNLGYSIKDILEINFKH